MISAIMIIGTLFGFIVAVLLILYGPYGLDHRPRLYKILDFLVNSIRSFPVLILIVAMSPVTKQVMGTTIGERAAILPLAIAATAFIARLLENSFIEVDKQLIEAAQSFGATSIQIVFRVIVKESIPSMISTLTLTAITFLSATTIAGAVGGGGLGAVALNYGYQSFNNVILYTCVLILFIMVWFIQFIGNLLYKRSQ
ncbi:MAG: ABC transporter permease subunit [Clostridiaceae bacterium]|nr:ABC transporter permease subunit [Clostridiaceae bacterium]